MVGGKKDAHSLSYISVLVFVFSPALLPLSEIFLSPAVLKMDTFSFLGRTAWEAFAEPLMTSAGVYEAPDRTYGRSHIPFSPMEKRLHANPNIDVRYGKAMLSNGKDWSWYQVWEDKEAQRRTGRRADMIFVHGTGVHSGTLASHSRRYLDAGFRLIVPDLVSHGYSSGVHVYQRNMSAYTEGLHAVLHDVARRDDALWLEINGDDEDEEESRNGEDLYARDFPSAQRQRRPTKADRRPTFMLGLSFGGSVALSYALDYPLSLREELQGQDEIPIDGIIAVGPILGKNQANLHIPLPLQWLIKGADRWLGAGRVEVLVPHRKVLDKDPKVYKSLVTEDQRSHHGAFRVGHLLCINDSLSRLQAEAHTVRHPVYLQQGGQDRVACHEASINWIRNISSEDKRMAVYPVCQHVIYRKGKTEEEDLAGRLACIEDNLEWMSYRAPGAYGLTKTFSPWSSSASLSITTSSLSTPSRKHSSTFTDGLLGVGGFADQSFSSSSSSLSTPILSGRDDASFSFSGPSEPDMTEVPPSPGVFSFSSPIEARGMEKLEFSKPDFALLDNEAHPLLARAHHTTLPLLNRLCPERAYRPDWILSQVLRPYDIKVQ